MTRLVLSRHLPADSVERIKSAVPGVDVVLDPSAVLPAAGRVGLMYKPGDRTEAHDLTTEELNRKWDLLLQEADVLFDLHPRAIDLIADGAPNLKFIQGIASGAGELLKHEGLLRSGVPIATARGVHDDGLADFALASILYFSKRFDELQAQKAAHAWKELPARQVSGKTLCVVGFGSIGKAVSTRARAFGINVTGVRTKAGHDDLASRIYGIDELNTALAGADFVVVALPAAPSTDHLFDASAFASFKHGAFLVNVGRGSVIEEAALVDALETGAIAGASLDVANREPLPPGDKLWTAPNLIISPHSASLVPGYSIDKIVDVLIENLKRHQAGQPLLHVADAPS